MEKLEVACIFVAIVLATWISTSNLLPDQVRVSSLILILSNIILVQSLLRDLLLVMKTKKDKNRLKPKKCICLESTIGLSGVLLGGFLMVFFASSDALVPMSSWKWIVISTMGLIGCYLMKDWIFTWSPMGIKRDKERQRAHSFFGPVEVNFGSAVLLLP